MTYSYDSADEYAYSRAKKARQQGLSRGAAARRESLSARAGRAGSRPPQPAARQSGPCHRADRPRRGHQYPRPHQRVRVQLHAAAGRGLGIRAQVGRAAPQRGQGRRPRPGQAAGVHEQVLRRRGQQARQRAEVSRLADDGGGRHARPAQAHRRQGEPHLLRVPRLLQGHQDQLHLVFRGGRLRQAVRAGGQAARRARGRARSWPTSRRRTCAFRRPTSSPAATF